MRRRVALATCAALPDLDEDDRLLVPGLERRDIEAVAAVWDDPRVDWPGFDLVLLRSTWDYAERHEEFVAWAERVPRLANSAGVVRWNTDKRYLADLERAGVPIVPSRFLEPGADFAPPQASYVVKPSVSAGGRSSGRFEGTEGRVLVERLHAEGRTAMLQPYLPRADVGETGLVYVGGRYSHAVRRRVPLPEREPPAGELLYLEETLGPATATEAELRVADHALAAAASLASELLYARVDLLHDDSGAPIVNEVELTEPSLYLRFGDGAAERFADAIAEAVSDSGRRAQIP